MGIILFTQKIQYTLAIYLRVQANLQTIVERRFGMILRGSVAVESELQMVKEATNDYLNELSLDEVETLREFRKSHFTKIFKHILEELPNTESSHSHHTLQRQQLQSQKLEKPKEELITLEKFFGINQKEKTKNCSQPRSQQIPCCFQTSWRDQSQICLKIPLRSGYSTDQYCVQLRKCSHLPCLIKLLVKILICLPLYLLFTSLQLLLVIFIFCIGGIMIPPLTIIATYMYIQERRDNCILFTFFIIILPVTLVIGFLNALDFIFLFGMSFSHLTKAEGIFKSFLLW